MNVSFKICKHACSERYRVFVLFVLFISSQSTLVLRHCILSENVLLFFYIRDLEYLIYFSVKLSVVMCNLKKELIKQILISQFKPY